MATKNARKSSPTKKKAVSEVSRRKSARPRGSRSPLDRGAEPSRASSGETHIARSRFLHELQWRGVLHDLIPGTDELLAQPGIKGYIGFDPTADSLGVGHLAQIMMLLHFQRAGHHPVVLIGGATGLVGDPSGKSHERDLLTEEVLEHNAMCVRRQLEKFIDFQSGHATVLNNADWFRPMRVLDFIREVGKHVTVNSMLAKDSVTKRIGAGGEGMSFAEFSYQLVQGFDFLHLWRHHGVQLQMGGSDQWGNIVTGTELIRKKAQQPAWGLTTHLITKSDGTKFGKTEAANVWLDPARTSPYAFHQFWLNVSDSDAAKWIRVFTTRAKDEVEALERSHWKSPSLRLLQRTLADDVTTLVHSRADAELAAKAAEVLFGHSPVETLRALSEEQIVTIFKDVPSCNLSRDSLAKGISLMDLLTGFTGFVSSKGEARRLVTQKALAVNGQKLRDLTTLIDASALLVGRYLLLARGRKDHFLVRVG